MNKKNCFIVAEVAQAHDGSLGMAHAYIDAVSKTGVDAIKFQTHIAQAESSFDEPWRIKFSLQDANRYAYWKRMEFSEEEWRGLKNHAVDKGIEFMSSPFSFEAVDLLSRLEMRKWKIPSGEVNNTPLLSYIAKSAETVFISSGLSTIQEIDEAVRLFKEAGVKISILQCTSAYPTPPEKVGLNMLEFFHGRYDCEVGLSDHSGTIFPSLAAITLGATVLEIHITFSREMYGPDTTSSITTKDLKKLVDGVRFIEKALANPVNKDNISSELSPIRSAFTKSVVASRFISAGTVLQRTHLGLKKPGTGIPAAELNGLVGRKILRSIAQDEQILRENLE